MINEAIPVAIVKNSIDRKAYVVYNEIRGDYEEFSGYRKRTRTLN